MDNNELTKEEIQKLLKFEGQIRGLEFIADKDFVLKKEGEKGMEKIKEKLEEWGVPINYESIRSMDFYPGGKRIISLLAIKEAFKYGDEVIEEMGKAACRHSLVIKFFVGHFGTISKFFIAHAPEVWKRYWTIGAFVPGEYSVEKRTFVAQVKGIDLHPVYCLYLGGYFSALTQMTTGSSKAFCREVKCRFRGDDIHEYATKW